MKTLVLILSFMLPAVAAAQPPDSPELFLPGTVSTHLAERDAALSPDGREFYYTINNYFHQVIVFTTNTPIGWSQPQVASFSGVYADLEPHFSPDGQTMYFSSNRPLEKGGEAKDFDIWYVKRENGSWGEPQNLGEPVNTPANEFYPSISKAGTLYWCAKREGGPGGEDLFFSHLEDGRYINAQALSDSVNTRGDEYNAFVARDESYIIFTSSGWGRGQGSGDLWISYRKEDGSWTKAVNMGPQVNSPAFEFCPFVSDDGRYLFFTSNRTDDSQQKSPVSYNDILEFSQGPQNKQHNIYFISAEVIDTLNPLNKK